MGEIFTAVTHTRAYEISGTSHDEMADFIATLGQRHDVIRTGERAEIPLYVRVAVYMRDDYTCGICGQWLKGSDKNLDHAVPWSAGGSDRSENLRTSCPDCNEQRSNRRDGSESRLRLPVTWWCASCWRPHTWTGRYGPPSWVADLGPPSWYSATPYVDPDEDRTVLAYCAMCRAEDYTNRPL